MTFIVLSALSWAKDSRSRGAYWVYLGMDIATSSVKAVLVDGAGASVDPASAALPIDGPQLAVNPRPAGLLLFDGAIRHAGKTPNRNCPSARYTFAIKPRRG
jgi:hypothetical protein